MKTKRILLTVAAAVIITVVFVCILCACNKDEIPDVVDFTALNDIMARAELSDMLYTRPEKYLGKTVIAQGQYAKTYLQTTDTTYHYVYICLDETGCCPAGFEIICENDYPDEGALIEVEGAFAEYEERGKTYYHLVITKLTVK
jgi:hypothetical protein